MRRIPTLIQKLQELAEQGKDITVLDVDLMLDYTRVLYADLLEIRKVIPTNIITEEPDPNNIPVQENTPATEEVREPTPEPMHPTPALTDIPDKDIRTYIGINDKYLYISELFDNDKTAYDDAIKQLNNFRTASEATSWTQQVLQSKYAWDNEDETVQAFYDLLNSCFDSI